MTPEAVEAVEARTASRASSGVSPWRSLTFKQAVLTLLVALVLGLAVGAVQLWLDWGEMRKEVRRSLDETLSLVEGSASEAVYQLHEELGRQLIDGLFALESLRRAELRDDFGQVLAEREHPMPVTGLTRDWAWLFADICRVQRPLTYAVGSEQPALVGQLSLELAPEVLVERFLRQALTDSLLGSLRALFISALVVAIFYLMITRPLLRLGAAIARVDPANPGRWQAPALPTHRRDELGLLLNHLQHLLGASQAALDERDRARAELSALARDLEVRVRERTAELEQQKDVLARAFSELETTHGELARANRLVLESIQYARRIQTAMLPDKAALDGRLAAIQVRWEPLHLVGGDWFWLEPMGERSLILIADCTGHGVPGAFITLVLASAMKEILRAEGARDPAQILLAIDRLVRARLRQDHPEAESDDGLEAAVAIWDPARRALEFAGAGIPLLCVSPEGRVETIRSARAHLGYRSLPPPEAIPVHRVVVAPGARFYLLTDGVSDHMGGTPPRLLGRRRLAEWLAGQVERSLQDQVADLQRLLDAYRGREPRRDDMTLIAFQPLPSDPPPLDSLRE